MSGFRTIANRSTSSHTSTPTRPPAARFYPRFTNRAPSPIPLIATPPQESISTVTNTSTVSSPTQTVLNSSRSTNEVTEF